MALITRFSPLGNLTDLTTNTQLGDWSREVEHLMSTAVSGIERYTERGKAQFADPSVIDMGAAAAKAISWKGFPLSLAAQGFSDDDALKIADGMMADTQGATGRDVQDEYLEWHVERDANGDVVRIDFTTEGPEYWSTLDDDLGRSGVVQLYQQYYPDATEAVLYHGGAYDPDNAFNLNQGAMHLRQAANYLSAEVQIAAQSTLTYTRRGVTLTSGADLCRYARLGVATRASDPHIAETVNNLARTGCRLSLLDPVGLYMDPPDFTGWVTPDGSDPKALWRTERGNPVTRGSLRSPGNFKLSDVKIAGQKIAYGGQVAKLISVHLTGLATGPHTVTPTVVPVESLHAAPASPALAAFAFVRLGRVASRTGR